MLDSGRRLILLGLVVAMAATLALVQLRGLLAGGAPTDSIPAAISRGQPAPAIVGTTLDGATFDLASLHGRPVIVNFWGPSCVPCRDEFPLFKEKLAAHADTGLVIVGILMDDPVGPAQAFITQYGATWPTVEDPAKALRGAYRVAARPQSYFIDRDGILRSIQVGQLTDPEFERQYALISGPSASGAIKPKFSIEIPPNQ